MPPDSGWDCLIFFPVVGPNGPMRTTLVEKIYFVLEGELTVKSKTEEFVLRKGDSLFLGPNEGRELINNTNMPASMLVVINYPE